MTGFTKELGSIRRWQAIMTDQPLEAVCANRISMMCLMLVGTVIAIAIALMRGLITSSDDKPSGYELPSPAPENFK
jgi:hypothetical protein